MQTVFLSEPTLFRQEILTNHEQKPADDFQDEIELLPKYSQQHGNINFDRLPTCPLCLEKLDATVTGMHQTPCEAVSYKPVS